jgi:SAM-dependent methyltransferase
MTESKEIDRKEPNRPSEAGSEAAAWNGFCPICRQETRFIAKYNWFRDHLICTSCPGGSVPRERALMKVIEEIVPNWRRQCIHESSPLNRGTSMILARECVDYVPTHLFPCVALGENVNGVRCENLEQQTFKDATFDVVVTQDVMEHVFQPERAYQEIARTLKRGGVHIHTTPIYKDQVKTRICARRLLDGSVEHVEPPEYHGNPISESGSLVTVKFGYDIADLIAEWTNMDIEVRRFSDRTHGIVGEFTEVIICRKG